jgi:hypothetical protein
VPKHACRFLLPGCLAALTAVTGCSGMRMQLPGLTGSAQPTSANSANPLPIVQNCGIVAIGSPTKYACDGKVYTSFELARLRENRDQNHGS